MTTVEIRSQNAHIIGFSVSGHSGYAEAGSDIVCAAISAITELTINALTEIAKAKGEVCVDEAVPIIGFSLTSQPTELVDALFEAYALEVKALAEEYMKYIKVILMEV